MEQAKSTLSSKRNKLLAGVASLGLVVGGLAVSGYLTKISHTVSSISHDISGVGSKVGGVLNSLPAIKHTEPPQITSETVSNSITYAPENIVIGGEISSLVAVNAIQHLGDGQLLTYDKVYPITDYIGSTKGVNYTIQETVQNTNIDYSNGQTKDIKKVIAINASLNQPSTQAVVVDYSSPANYAPINSSMTYSQDQQAVENYLKKIETEKNQNPDNISLTPIQTHESTPYLQIIGGVMGDIVGQIMNGKQINTGIELESLSGYAAILAGEVQTYDPNNKNWQNIITTTNQEVKDQLAGQFPGAKINVQSLPLQSQFAQLMATINDQLKAYIKDSPYAMTFNYDKKTGEGALVVTAGQAKITVLLGSSFNNPTTIDALNKQLNS